MLKAALAARPLAITVLMMGASAPITPAETALEVTADDVAAACAPGIQALIDEVETGRSARVTDWNIYDLADIYMSDPSEAPFGLWRRGHRPAADSVMVSPQFMTRLSTNLIEGCDAISLVVFNRDQTGWTEEFAQVDGEVTALACVGNDYNWVDPIPRGQRICGL